MLENIISLLSGIVLYLFLEYIWRPHLKPIFDRKFLNKTDYYLHNDLQTLYKILDHDWTSQHTLPRFDAYNDLLNKILPELKEYISEKECINLSSAFEKLNILVNEKPKPAEIIEANDFIHSTLLVMLTRIALQVPPYTKIN